MTSGPRLHLLLILIGLFGLSGASCPRGLQQITNPLPRLLPATPPIEQVVEVVNRNNSQIRSFSADRASISVPGYPTLGTTFIAFERPKRFRMRAGTGVLGPELDLGSNDDLFWFWLKRNEPPGVYFCRHDQFATSQARLAVPFDPEWLVEVLGVAEFDPALPHQLTYLPNDRLRIDTVRNTPEGAVTKITILDGSQGWILEQHLYDARRQRIASSIAGGHRRDPLSGLVMPTVVSVDCPAAKLNMRIDLGNIEINRLSGDPAQLWTMPNYPNAPLVDMADPSFQPPMSPSRTTASSQLRPMPAGARRAGR
jgi:hypothetical protein